MLKSASVAVILSVLLCNVPDAKAQEFQPKSLEKPKGYSSVIDEAEYEAIADDGDEVRLQKQKIRAARLVFSGRLTKYQSNLVTLSVVIEARNLFIEALLDFHEDELKREAILEDDVKFAIYLETLSDSRLNVGMVDQDEHALAVFNRSNAELKLLREKQ